MKKIKQFINSRKDDIYKGIESNDCYNGEILHNAMSLIWAQAKYIKDLEIELNMAINKLEDLIDIEKIKSVSTNVTESYTVDDLRARNKERLNK